MTNSNIWGGSEIKVKAELKPWYSPQLGAGVKLQLMGVQVIKYVDGADVSVDDFGFKAEEGYVQPTEPTAAEDGFEENPPAALNADALPQSDLAVEQPTLKDSGKPVIEKIVGRLEDEINKQLSDKNVEIISGLTEGDIIVAEGLKKVRPRGKIKPINK